MTEAERKHINEIKEWFGHSGVMLRPATLSGKNLQRMYKAMRWLLELVEQQDKAANTMVDSASSIPYKDAVPIIGTTLSLMTEYWHRRVTYVDPANSDRAIRSLECLECGRQGASVFTVAHADKCDHGIKVAEFAGVVSRLEDPA